MNVLRETKREREREREIERERDDDDVYYKTPTRQTCLREIAAPYHGFISCQLAFILDISSFML